jgi:uncharacterized protein
MNCSSNKGIGRTVQSNYRAPWWCPGGHLQTLYTYFFASCGDLAFRRERWETPDGDFIDLDWLDSDLPDADLIVLFHGLEGCARSHYALSLMTTAQQLGSGGVVVHFRGCSGEHNRLARAYHSGDSSEVDWILRRLRATRPHCNIHVVGVSLGANVLLKWLGEQGDAAREVVDSAVAVSAPVDLTAAAGVLDRGIAKWLYTGHFLKTLKKKALAKTISHKLPIDSMALSRASTFRELDDLYTAPIHGFTGAEHYWATSSSKPWLKHIAVPTLLINALNDPFLPAAALPDQTEVAAAVVLEYPEAGGHVGFVSGIFPGSMDWLPRRILAFVEEKTNAPGTAGAAALAV